MYPTRIAQAEPYRPGQAAGDDSRSALPQPMLRLMGAASIGIGAGLFSVSAPAQVLLLTFAPAMVAIVLITVQSIRAIPEPTPIDEPTKATDG